MECRMSFSSRWTMSPAMKLDEWNPIETAPHNEHIDVYGWRWQGELAPGGRYKYYWMTVGEIDGSGKCSDLMTNEGDFGHDEMPNPTHWRPRPTPPPKT
jgi:hypothetical protein